MSIMMHDAAIRAMRERGMLRDDIAEELGISPKSVSAAFKRLGYGARKAIAVGSDRFNALLAELKERVAKGESVDAVAPQIGITRDVAWGILRKAGVSIVDLRPKLPAGWKKGRSRGPQAPRATPAQLHALEEQRETQRRIRKRLPLPAQEEAERAIAEYLARHSVTQCPPAAPITAPINAGMRFR